MSDDANGSPRPPVRVLRIIARLNIGGPAIQALSLTRMLEPRGFSTLLVRGSEDPDEGNMDHLARSLGVSPRRVSQLRRNPGAHDLPALLRLLMIVARERPRIVHTHAAKAGTLGRAAVLLAPGRRGRILVHTFHGHSLNGYFSARANRVFLAIERYLARRTDRLVAVSGEVRDELVALGVAPVERFTVIPLGFDLTPFLIDEPERTRRRAKLRAELAIPPRQPLVTLVARLVPIKRVDRFLAVAQRLAAERPEAHFLIVGDGELRDELHEHPAARALDGRLTWAGFRLDMPDVCFASDVVVLTSDNEGTPVSLIEALAAEVPVVSTRVGGVPSVVLDGETGLLAEADDVAGLARGVAELLDDPQLAGRVAEAGRRHARTAFSLARLVDDIEALYQELTERRPEHARDTAATGVRARIHAENP